MHQAIASAATRKLDQIRAQEKMLERERALEGDEFADKEKFVTQAYKDQMEAVRKAEEEEQKREGADPSSPWPRARTLTAFSHPSPIHRPPRRGAQEDVQGRHLGLLLVVPRPVVAGARGRRRRVARRGRHPSTPDQPDDPASGPGPRCAATASSRRLGDARRRPAGDQGGARQGPRRRAQRLWRGRRRALAPHARAQHPAQARTAAAATRRGRPRCRRLVQAGRVRHFAPRRRSVVGARDQGADGRAPALAVRGGAGAPAQARAGARRRARGRRQGKAQRRRRGRERAPAVRGAQATQAGGGAGRAGASGSDRSGRAGIMSPCAGNRWSLPHPHVLRSRSSLGWSVVKEVSWSLQGRRVRRTGATGARRRRGSAGEGWSPTGYRDALISRRRVPRCRRRATTRPQTAVAAADLGASASRKRSSVGEPAGQTRRQLALNSTREREGLDGRTFEALPLLSRLAVGRVSWRPVRSCVSARVRLGSRWAAAVCELESRVARY